MGPTLDKINDVTLEQCVHLCNSRPICSYFNFFYSKIELDIWSKCILIYSTRSDDIYLQNGDFVIR